MKRYKILKRNKNCVLLERNEDHYFKLFDVEGDVICITRSYATADGMFNSFDLDKIHAQQREQFAKELKEIAEA